MSFINLPSKEFLEKEGNMSPNGFIEGVKSRIENTILTTEINNIDKKKTNFKPSLIWKNIISIALIHLAAAWAVFKWCFHTKFYTYLWAAVIGTLGAFGVTAGAHRLWTHRSYKATWQLRIILILCYSIAGQNSLYDWVRDHRVHHKYSETDADPHNSKRGFFFAHVGWLMQKKHPEVLKKGKLIDMSDLLQDPIVNFHQRHFLIFKIMLCFVIPILVPYYFWNESLSISFFGLGCVRYVLGLNFTWLVNSAAHIWGKRPYDKRISPTENLAVAIVAFGEGWHNYHHVFPWDYKAAELGDYKFNFTTLGLDVFKKIGWAYDAKEPSKALVMKVSAKYGDGTHKNCPSPHEVDENGVALNCLNETV